jgi:hypothetical protein
VFFAGKGVAALQETGKLPASSLHFPTIDVLGLQAVLIIVAVVLVHMSRRKTAGSKLAAQGP